MFALRGVLTGEVEGGFWIVPPLCNRGCRAAFSTN